MLENSCIIFTAFHSYINFKMSSDNNGWRQSFYDAASQGIQTVGNKLYEGGEYAIDGTKRVAHAAYDTLPSLPKRPQKINPQEIILVSPKLQSLEQDPTNQKILNAEASMNELIDTSNVESLFENKLTKTIASGKPLDLHIPVFCKRKGPTRFLTKFELYNESIYMILDMLQPEETRFGKSPVRRPLKEYRIFFDFYEDAADAEPALILNVAEFVRNGPNFVRIRGKWVSKWAEMINVAKKHASLPSLQKLKDMKEWVVNTKQQLENRRDSDERLLQDYNSELQQNNNEKAVIAQEVKTLKTQIKIRLEKQRSLKATINVDAQALKNRKDWFNVNYDPDQLYTKELAKSELERLTEKDVKNEDDESSLEILQRILKLEAQLDALHERYTAITQELDELGIKLKKQREQYDTFTTRNSYLEKEIDRLTKSIAKDKNQIHFFEEGVTKWTKRQAKNLKDRVFNAQSYLGFNYNRP